MNIEKGKKYQTKLGAAVEVLGETRGGWLVATRGTDGLIADYWHVNPDGTAMHWGTGRDVFEPPKVHKRYVVWYKKAQFPDAATSFMFKDMAQVERFLKQPRMHPFSWYKVQEITFTEEQS
jgi:hypothetical protein